MTSCHPKSTRQQAKIQHENQLKITDIWKTLTVMFIINKRHNMRQYGELNNPDAGNHIRPQRANIHHKNSTNQWTEICLSSWIHITPTFLKATLSGKSKKTKTNLRIRDSLVSVIQWTSLLIVSGEVRSHSSLGPSSNS